MRQYIVLITDGEPNCADPARTSGSDLDNTVRRIEALAAQGVSTFVIGYDLERAHVAGMDRMAQAGATGHSAHIAVTNASELDQALAQIEKAVVNPCSLPLSAPLPANAQFTVRLSGQALPLKQDDANGFTLDAARRVITLQASSCDALKNVGASISVEMVCHPATTN